MLSLSENKLKNLKALHVKKYRERAGAFLAEGVRLCEEAIAAHAEITAAVVTIDKQNQPRIENILQYISAPIYQATQKQMQMLCNTETPQGICLIMEIPRHTNKKYSETTLILDALQDPGNVGTILRTADWFGVTSIFLSQGCVDVYNPKVVRASMGSIFRLDLYQDVVATNQCETLSAHNYHIAAAVMQGNTKITDIRRQKTALIIGNEANGISKELIDIADSLVYIPAKGHGESLNAAIAASLFIYQLTTHE